MRSWIPRSPFLWLFLLAPIFLSGAGPARAEFPCDSCKVVVDTCSAGRPAYTDTAFTNNFAPGDRLNALTCWAPNPCDFVLAIFDLGPPRPAYNVNWYAPAFHGPGQLPCNTKRGSWVRDTLGSIFGITFDRPGNLYVTHTAAYSIYSGPTVKADYLGKGGAGAVYKIDRITGKVSVFAVLPNLPGPPISGSDPTDNYAGLGNISYDPGHGGQFFVTDVEDGKIYRLSNAGAILSAYDPGAPDPGTAGAAPLGERMWGVKVHGGRVYYSRWNEDFGSPSGPPNEIRSVGLDSGGNFLGWDDRLELLMPTFSGAFSNPVSDISFGPQGQMLLSERGMQNSTTTVAHQSRLLEYVCQNGQWVPSGNTFGGGSQAPSSSAGGNDYDWAAYVAHPGVDGRRWATFDAIHTSFPDGEWVYGLIGLQPTGGNYLNSFIIDADEDVVTHDKQLIGDVAMVCPADSGAIHGHKFWDGNHNGVQDPGAEPPVAGWTIQLTDAGGATYTTTTNSSGEYWFMDLFPGTYTVSELGHPGWVQTGPQGTPYGVYQVNLGSGEVLTNLNFGNDSCFADTSCAYPPLYMSAWWPFDEPTTTTTVRDVTHLTPLKNVGTLFASANVISGGKVGNALFPSGNGYAQVNNAGSVGINFGPLNFSIDGWVQALGPGSNPFRTIVDKRVSAGSNIAGYWFFLQNVAGLPRLGFEMGVGGLPLHFVSSAPLPPSAFNAWHHVAVTISRSANGGKLYVDGVLTDTFTPLTGNVNNASNLYIGQQTPAFAPSPFEGYIDELEFFRQAVDSSSIRRIWAAGKSGKCKEICRVPKAVSFCKNQSVATACMTICNYTTQQQKYFWSMAGLPVGPGCSVAGPTIYSPPAGMVTIAAGACANVCVNITRPAGLTGVNTACYAFTVVNDTTRNCFQCKGVVQSDTTWWCVQAKNAGVVTIGTSGGPVGFTIDNACPIPTDFTYTIVARPTHGDPADAQVVRLNGLPPGTPVFGTLSIPASGSGEVLVNVEYDGYQPFGLHEIVLSHDIDGDGTPEDLAAEGVISEEDTSGTVGIVPEEPLRTSTRIDGAPNPFQGQTAIDFTLARTQNVDVNVFDLNGRLVRRLHTGRLIAGKHVFRWNGADSRDRPSAAGVYFVRLQSADATLKTKVVRIE